MNLFLPFTRKFRTTISVLKKCRKWKCVCVKSSSLKLTGESCHHGWVLSMQNFSLAMPLDLQIDVLLLFIEGFHPHNTSSYSTLAIPKGSQFKGLVYENFFAYATSKILHFSIMQTRQIRTPVLRIPPAVTSQAKMKNWLHECQKWVSHMIGQYAHI